MREDNNDLQSMQHRCREAHMPTPEEVIEDKRNFLRLLRRQIQLDPAADMLPYWRFAVGFWRYGVIEETEVEHARELVKKRLRDIAVEERAQQLSCILMYEEPDHVDGWRQLVPDEVWAILLREWEGRPTVGKISPECSPPPYFDLLLETARLDLQHAGDGDWQAIALKTEEGLFHKVFPFDAHHQENAQSLEQDLRREGKTHVQAIVCLMPDSTPSVPSFAMRDMLNHLQEGNYAALILVQVVDDYAAVPLLATY
ncbi:MAG: hypothetical protein IJU16_00375 [Clostridia bacterium]|nr:hypothetical protein [Clostridia bacterium]